MNIGPISGKASKVGTELTDIDVEMEEHYSLSLPSLSPVHISESFLHTDDNTHYSY